MKARFGACLRIFRSHSQHQSAESIRAAATDAIEDKALPAYRRLNDYFNNTYCANVGA